MSFRPSTRRVRARVRFSLTIHNYLSQTKKKKRVSHVVLVLSRNGALVDRNGIVFAVPAFLS